MKDGHLPGDRVQAVSVGSVTGLVGKLDSFQTTATGGGYYSTGKVGVVWTGFQYLNTAMPALATVADSMRHQYKCVTDDPVQFGDIYFDVNEQVYFSGMAGVLDPLSPGWWWYALNYCYQGAIMVNFFDAESGEWDFFYAEEEVNQEGIDYEGDFSVRAPGAAYGEHGTAQPPASGTGNPTPVTEAGSPSFMHYITADTATGGAPRRQIPRASRRVHSTRGAARWATRRRSK